MTTIADEVFRELSQAVIEGIKHEEPPKEKKRKPRQKKPHPDSPFSREDIIAFKAMLYSANCSVPCLNAPHPSWIKGYNLYHQGQYQRDLEEYEREQALVEGIKHEQKQTQQ